MHELVWLQIDASRIVSQPASDPYTHDMRKALKARCITIIIIISQGVREAIQEVKNLRKEAES